MIKKHVFIGMYDLLRTGPMVEIASALMKEPAVLYKEKVNYKLTGESKMDSLRLRNLNQKNNFSDPNLQL